MDDSASVRPEVEGATGDREAGVRAGKVSLAMDINIHHYLHFDAGQLAQIGNQLHLLLKGQRRIMATLDEIQANEEHEGTAVGQLADAVTGLKDNITQLRADLAAALSGAVLSPENQAKVDAAFAKSKANSDKVDEILTSLAPPAP